MSIEFLFTSQLPLQFQYKSHEDAKNTGRTYHASPSQPSARSALPTNMLFNAPHRIPETNQLNMLLHPTHIREIRRKLEKNVHSDILPHRFKSLLRPFHSKNCIISQPGYPFPNKKRTPSRRVDILCWADEEAVKGNVYCKKSNKLDLTTFRLWGRQKTHSAWRRIRLRPSRRSRCRRPGTAWGTPSGRLETVKHVSKKKPHRRWNHVVGRKLFVRFWQRLMNCTPSLKNSRGTSRISSTWSAIVMDVGVEARSGVWDQCSWAKESRELEREKRRDSGVATGLASKISGKARRAWSSGQHCLVKCHLASNGAWGRVRPRFSRL